MTHYEHVMVAFLGGASCIAAFVGLMMWMGIG
jgi:hypothetical protein